MNKCILFFDIDGTILTEDGTRIIPESTGDALLEAKKNGHLLFVNTGRVFLNVEPMIRTLGFDGFVCGCGTHIIYQNKELFHHELDSSLYRKTVEITRKCKMDVLYEARDLNALDGCMEKNKALKELITYFTQDGRRMVSVDDSEFHFDKFTAWYPLEYTDMQKEFKEFALEYFDYIDRGIQGDYGMCEIVPKGYSKGTGIQYLLEYFNLPHDRSYAFGDSTNDLPMLTFAAHSVAMGGSPEVVKDKVEYVTGTIDEDGLAEAMRYYGLI